MFKGPLSDREGSLQVTPPFTRLFFPLGVRSYRCVIDSMTRSSTDRYAVLLKEDPCESSGSGDAHFTVCVVHGLSKVSRWVIDKPGKTWQSKLILLVCPILLILAVNIKHMTWLGGCQKEDTFSNYGIVLLWAAEAFYWCQPVFCLQSREEEANIFPRDLGVALPQRQVFKSLYKYFTCVGVCVCVLHACG